jgi:hypothetical protein
MQARRANVGYGEIYSDRLRPVIRAAGQASDERSGQYAPYTLTAAGPIGTASFAQDTWDSQRDAIAKQFVELIGASRPTSPSASRNMRCRAGRH